MVNRGEIFWADLAEPAGSTPAKRRPVLIVQADGFNASRLPTVIVVVITSNTALATMPGNVFLPKPVTGLRTDSVVNVTALATIDRRFLEPHPVTQLPSYAMEEVDAGIRQVLGL